MQRLRARGTNITSKRSGNIMTFWSERSRALCDAREILLLLPPVPPPQLDYKDGDQVGSGRHTILPALRRAVGHCKIP